MNSMKNATELFLVFNRYVGAINRQTREQIIQVIKKLAQDDNTERYLNKKYPKEVIVEVAQLAAYSAIDTFFNALKGYDYLQESKSDNKTSQYNVQ